ncbi:MAG: hypothetical protein ABIQ01_09260 [Pseudolysinimonas sp.]
MMRVHYSGGSFLAATDVATTVLDYSAALANAERAQLVGVPAIDVDGNPEVIQVLLGPASQLYAEPVPHSGETDELEFVQRTRSAMELLEQMAD